MQSKIFTAFFVVCMTVLVSAAPVPLPDSSIVAIREVPQFIQLETESSAPPVAREASPEPQPEAKPGCFRYFCF
ncbi:hypothetical protein BDQ12DRAFT_718049 [Crucibulum laeve]|uniref:Secreted protein n=1 Tax=Crucibulum laeve TaxID=68775 RepID=A0A5C3MU44_9AGAR|nr:hypothetical protein BDQ12DRAFT_718049 [Crucibulum laeve]